MVSHQSKQRIMCTAIVESMSKQTLVSGAIKAVAIKESIINKKYVSVTIMTLML